MPTCIILMLLFTKTQSLHVQCTIIHITYYYKTKKNTYTYTRNNNLIFSIGLLNVLCNRCINIDKICVVNRMVIVLHWIYYYL